MMKNLPAKYIFAGYAVKKSTSVVSSMVDGKLVFDVFTYVYVDNQLTMFLLMENGKYKSVEYNVEVDSYDGNAIMSKHLYRGEQYNQNDYELFDKEQVIGGFGLRNIEEIMVATDEYAASIGVNDMKVQALLDVKSAYTGMEVSTVLGKFNKLNSWSKGFITVPPITYGFEDTYESAIGDELEFYDLLSNKSPDDFIRDLKKITDSLDGLGNKLEE
jgi:hypothetical protein